MHTPLQIKERDVLKDLCTNHPIYIVISNVVLELSVECTHFHLMPEDVFMEIMDMIDTIREIDEDSKAIEYVQQLYKRLRSHYRQITTNQTNVQEDIELYVAEIIYGAALALSIAKSKPHQLVATALCDLVSIAKINKLYPIFSKNIKLLNNQQLCEWDEYLLSDTYIADNLIDALTRTDYCTYIVRENIATSNLYTLNEYEAQLKRQCQKEAKTLIEFLIRGENLGYLDFGRDKLKDIYNELKMHFPNSIKYSYTNFAAASKEYDWHSKKIAT